MVNGRFTLLFLLAFCVASCRPDNVDQPSSIIAEIDVLSAGEPLSGYLYGMFLEHLGNADVGDIIDDGIWAEVLDDRKFFYPVDTLAAQMPVNKRDSVNQWVPANHARAVTMDSVNPYVGVHSPKILVGRESIEGIAQSGLAVIAGKKYTGRIAIAGSPGVAVTISLIWGETASERSSFSINRLTPSFDKHYFSLASEVNTNNARIEITGSGKGTFSVGAISLMPEDNIAGFRQDVIRLLKDLNSGLYRWGGNMSSGYDWRDGIGDPDRRPPRYEYAWDGLENNDVGTHELIRFAELINVELSLTVNTGFGDANSAAEWVQYVNGAKETAMGKSRAQNGHPEPFGIKLWCVGNESYGWWQLGHIDLRNHIIKHKMFAEKMLEVDPTIKLIASGASLEEMTITGSAQKLTGKILAEYDSASDWTGGMLRHASHTIDYMSEHFYCSVDQRFDFNEGRYVKIDEPLVDWTRRPANRVKAKAEHYAEYHRRMPYSKRIPVYMDEWAYFTNWVHPAPTLGVVIGYARGLHEMFRNADLIKMAGFTFGTSCISFNDTDAIYNASGMMFRLYQSKFGSIPLKISGNMTQPRPRYPVGGDQPSINAGGDTYPLDMVAALTEDKKGLTLAIVNPTEEKQQVTVNLKGLGVSGKVTLWTLSGSSTMARNLVGNTPQVIENESKLDFADVINVEAATINIYRYELQPK